LVRIQSSAPDFHGSIKGMITDDNYNKIRSISNWNATYRQ
jgi:hypothetical protein